MTKKQLEKWEYTIIYLVSWVPNVLRYYQNYKG